MNNWKSYLLGNICHIGMGQSPTSTSCGENLHGLPFLQGCAEFKERVPETKINCSSPTRVAPKKSILISVRAPVGKLNRADRKYCIGRGLACISSTNVDHDFLINYLELEGHKFNRLSQGSTFDAINSKDLNNFEIVAPPLPHQRKIAKILTTVDNQIEKTEQLIAKYEAVKQGMMQDLFTRGVDENGKLRPKREDAPELYKESELGWIPREWEVEPAQNLCEAVIDCKNRTPPLKEDGYPVIRTSNVRNGKFVTNGLVFTDRTSYEIWTARGKPEANDVMITREAPVGEVCLVPKGKSVCLGQRMMMYKPSPEKLRYEFMLYALLSQQVQKRLLELAGGSTVGHVKVGDIRDLKLPTPDTTEQELIEQRLTKFFSLLSVETTTLNKLKSLKTALMQDLLTGKVEVTPDPEDN